jgi:hypothetical protein
MDFNQIMNMDDIDFSFLNEDNIESLPVKNELVGIDDVTMSEMKRKMKGIIDMIEIELCNSDAFFLIIFSKTSYGEVNRHLKENNFKYSLGSPNRNKMYIWI